MKTARNLLPYCFLQLLAYLSAVSFMKNSGSAILILLCILPFSICILSFVYGKHHDYRLLYAVCTGVLFLPFIRLFMNESALVYAMGYGGLSLICSWLGYSLKKA